MVELSLIIPCFNEEKHLEQCFNQLIDSLDQTKLNYDIMFVDDASEDGTLQIIKKICERADKCRFVSHPKNLGRGAAVKTGFAATGGQITGFIDIDLEIEAGYIPPIVNLIRKQGYDVVTGRRYYVLSQTHHFLRHILSSGYRILNRLLLGHELHDTETGCKFFLRETAGNIVLGSKNNGWFWDTEVMVRAFLRNLKIMEMPVLFLKKKDKKSTVHVVRDSIQYLIELLRLRKTIGLSYSIKSFIYWSPVVYDVTMWVLSLGKWRDSFKLVADAIPDNAFVVDVCCGTGRLYSDHLIHKKVRYIGLDINASFINKMRKKGVDARYTDLARDNIPEADYIVICSSFYHFREGGEKTLLKLKRAAKKAVIISEPVKNLSNSPIKWLGNFANKLTNPGSGNYRFRYDFESFRNFFDENGASEIIYKPGQQNALAIFNMEKQSQGT